MILHHHGQALVVRVERGAFGDGPGFEDAVDFKPQVVMEVRGVVALDAELEWRVRYRGGHARSEGAGSGVRSKCALLYVLF